MHCLLSALCTSRRMRKQARGSSIQDQGGDCYSLILPVRNNATAGDTVTFFVDLGRHGMEMTLLSQRTKSCACN